MAASAPRSLAARGSPTAPNLPASTANRCLVRMDGVVPLQRSLLTFGAPAVETATPWDRLDLGGGSWVDIARGFLRGADDLLEHVVTCVPWSCGRRRMYDRMVDDPRLSHRYGAPHDVPHPAFTIVREALVARYRVEL